MNKINRNFKRSLASLLILMMIFTLIPLNVLAEGSNKGIDVWIRIEGNDKSLVEYQKINVGASDISYVDGLKDFKATKPVVTHAIVKALEGANIDVKDPEVFSIAGGFISGIADYRGENSSWLYDVNGISAPVGANEYELKENDIIDLYYVLDWNNYYNGKLESSSKVANVGEELTLTFTAQKADWEVVNEYEPVENGIVKIKGEEKEYKTDVNGQVKIAFDKAGSYTILADKQIEEGNIVRPRPLTIEVREASKIEESINSAANWLIENDEVNEWVIMDLARGDIEISQVYLNEFRNDIEAKNGQFKSVTDYAKYSIVASSLGLDATDLFGYNLIEGIYNHKNVFAQGYNGGVFALIALDSKDYKLPEDAKWTRENILKELVKGQKEDGGFGWTKDMGSDYDMTAMTLQALSNYQDREEVRAVTEKALDYLSKNQKSHGGYENEWVGDSSESVAQVIIALTSLKIDPSKDERFVKEANLVEKLLSFQLEDGRFGNKTEEGSNALSTEQALRGLIAYNRFLNSESKLFNMKDVKTVELPEKPSINFDDIDQASNWAKESIAKAAELGLMKGIGNNKFAPKDNLTRAQFATLLNNLFELGAVENTKTAFADVKTNAWYYDAIMKAHNAGIIKGDGNKFFPDRFITREEMAVMIYRALNLAKVVEKQDIKDINTASHWAIDSINLMNELGIMTANNGKFNPKGKVSREMAATIIVRVYELD